MKESNSFRGIWLAVSVVSLRQVFACCGKFWLAVPDRGNGQQLAHVIPGRSGR